MTIEGNAVIDLVSISEDEKNAVLTMSDHLDLKDEFNHMSLLQNKINLYLGIIENGEIYEVYPWSKGKQIEIRICAKEFLEKAREIVEAGGYSFV